MLPVAEAKRRVLESAAPVGREYVPLDQAAGRVLGAPLSATSDQPPRSVSAMDGYAVRTADIGTLPVRLRVAVSVAAGQLATEILAPGEAARIFTGAPVPEGSDCVVIQENCRRDGDYVVVEKGRAVSGQFIRPRGLDFANGDTLLSVGRILTARDIGLAAAMNRSKIPVRRRPRILILATGDELVQPGQIPGPSQIVNSNSFALGALLERLGADPICLGIARDNAAALVEKFAAVGQADLLVTIGGASVGEHDLIQSVLTSLGMSLDFWKIAMRPGKPLLFGRWKHIPVMGLPGNPVSVIVLALVLIAPMIDQMLGLPERIAPRRARLGIDLAGNDERQDYLRARIDHDADGEWVMPSPKQDSSILSLLAQADCLAIRPPHAPPARRGEPLEILAFPPGV
ncbi:MAG TPA: gephyrin-like molybdotransferase Glp [Dongiaceae bacterium]|jgi:molybdopterin molybdotransferase|nr:gephyrin-like molybdotransferase Glp [Dongiaceae bacterium]